MTASAPPREHRLAEGHRVASRYTIGPALGEGGSGIVYRATRDEDGARVALKVIHRHHCGNRQIYQRFHREAAILKRVEGDHLVRLLEFVEDDGLLVIALEYVDGTSLEELLKAQAPLPVDQTVDIAVQICAALDAVHGAGIVHRDLKPANVLLERTPAGGQRVRVVDFGLAKVVHGEHMTTGLTEQDMIFGTPEYMAPEQARGDDVDPRCDIYALGCMLYEMAVGTVPFKKRTPIAAMTAHLTEEPPSPRSSKPDGSISATLEAVILRALAKRPADRYESVRAFADALRACRDKPQVIAPPGGGAVDDVSVTDLSLSRSAMEHSPTIPADAQTLRSVGMTKDLGLAATLPVDAGLPPAPVTPRAVAPSGAEKKAEAVVAAPPAPRSDLWLWILVAVVFAGIGIALGTLFGTR